MHRGLATVLSCLALACANSSGEGDSAGDEAESEGEAEGEGDGDGDGDETGESLRPNWHEDIAPLVIENCVGCHTEGGIAPFAMGTFDLTAPWASLMADSMEAGIMPPWHAIETDVCAPIAGFKHDARMSDEDIALVRDWAELGTPLGDPSLAAPLPDPQDLDLANPNTTVTMNTSLDVAVVGETRDFFHCLSLDPGNSEDVYLDGLQVIPGNHGVVHHVLVYVDEAGESASWPNGVQENCGGSSGGVSAALVSGWVPGGLPMEPPEGVGIPLPAGARLILNVHYHAIGGQPQVDSGTGLALRWSTEVPEYSSYFTLIGAPGIGDSLSGPFAIPAGATNHVEEYSWAVDAGGIDIPDSIDVRVWAIANHMHKVGVDMRVWIEDGADGSETCLLHTPKWDFNWQRVYEYDTAIGEGLEVNAGDVVHVRCEYDNSLDNPALVEALAEVGADAPVDVQLGEGTLDEMCLAGVGVGIKGLPPGFP